MIPLSLTGYLVRLVKLEIRGLSDEESVVPLCERSGFALSGRLAASCGAQVTFSRRRASLPVRTHPTQRSFIPCATDPLTDRENRHSRIDMSRPYIEVSV